MDDNQEREVPEGVVVASNGAWRDAQTGRFVKGMPATYNAITAENSSDLLRIRRQKQLEGILAADARLRGVSQDYWGDIAEHMYRQATSEKPGVAGVQAAKLVGEMTGLLASGRNGDSDPVPEGGARLELGAGAVQALVSVLAARNTGEQ